MSLHNECGFTGYRANGSFTVAMTAVIALQKLRKKANED
jgi:hypothetical protein